MKSETYISFILDELRKGETSFERVFELFLTKFNCSRPTFSKYWKQANEKHRETSQAIQIAKREQYTEHRIDDLKQGLLDLDDRKLILAEIAIGTTQREVNGKSTLPTDSERIKAISELNRIDGDYAPTKTDITGLDRVIIATNKRPRDQ